jgi:hypothetical protein
MLLKKKILVNYLYWFKFYKSFIFKNLKKYYLLDFFGLFIHKKMHRYMIHNKNKLYNISNGQILNYKKKKKIVKFFKKSNKSISGSINLLNKKFKKKLKSIFFFYCKNYNYKNYLWIKKYFYLLKPDLNFCVFTKGWSNVYKYRRRIKKKILKNLIKSSHSI